MALTDIARQLKETFEGFGGAEHIEELKKYRELYGHAECVQIGEMDYIVINDVYKSKEYADVPESTSPLFYNSIKNSYAIIDAETSSTLIDEVYSRVTYMQRICRSETAPDKDEVRRSMRDFTPAELSIPDVLIETGDNAKVQSNVFQCHLIKDTGVSAVPDVYSFALSNGEIKEISENVMRQIRRSGEVNLLKDRNVLEQNKAAIQQAVFDKYVNSDLDIQGVNVKSIFDISLTFQKIRIMLADSLRRKGVFNTSYIAGKNNEFEALNASIHVCDCGCELVDVKDPSNIRKLHLNIDAYDPTLSTETEFIYAAGCDDCLVECPDCHGWHFNYEKFIGSNIYDKAHIMPGRAFIKGLRSVDANYCACREGIEWVYDERTGSENEHSVIPRSKMTFFNYAGERIATGEDFAAFFAKRQKEKYKDALEESKHATRAISDFKKYLASKYDIDIKDISLSSSDKCMECIVCGGTFYRGGVAFDSEGIYRCDVCDELITERRSCVTRIDGIVFMRHRVGKRTEISKYIVSKFGNLKKLSSAYIEESLSDETDGDETESAESTASDSTLSPEDQAVVDKVMKDLEEEEKAQRKGSDA